MSLNRAIAHNTLIQIIGKAISTLLGMLALAVMTRTLGAEKIGWYVTATGFLQFIGILSDFGFTVTSSKMLAEPGLDRNKVLNTIFTWRFLSALLFNGLAPIIILFFPYNATIKIAVAVLSISFFASALIQVFTGYYRERLKMLLVTIGDVLSRVILVAGVSLAAHEAWGFLPIMVVITLASVISTLYVWRTIHGIKLHIDWAVSRIFWRKMWPTAVSTMSNACYLQADRVILPLFVAQRLVGFYGVAYRVLDVVTQIAALLMGLVMPQVTFSWSRNMLGEFKKRYQLGFNLLAMILLPASAGIFVLATPIMRWIFGPDFSNAGVVLRWLSISILGTCFGMIFGHIALAIDRQKETMWVYVSDAIFSVIAYLYFIAHYGWYGAIGVTIFSEFYAGFFLTLLTIRYSHVRPDMLPLIKILLASLIMALMLYLVQPLSLFLSILLGTIVYAALILLFGVTSIQTLKELLPQRNVATNT